MLIPTLKYAQTSVLKSPIKLQVTSHITLHTICQRRCVSVLSALHILRFSHFPCLAFLTAAFLCRIFMSRNFMSCIFSAPFCGTSSSKSPIGALPAAPTGGPLQTLWPWVIAPPLEPLLVPIFQRLHFEYTGTSLETYRSSSYVKVIGSRSRSQEQKGRSSVTKYTHSPVVCFD